MNVQGLIGKITGKADLLGKLYGYLGPMVLTAPFEPGLDPIGLILHQHEELLTDFTMPTLDSLKWHFDHLTKDAFIAALWAYLGGEIVGTFNSKWGNILKKFAEGTAMGAAASTLVMAAGGVHSPGMTPRGSSSSGSPTFKNGVLNQ